MRMIEAINAIGRFFQINRQTGTTTLLRKVLKEENAYVIVPDMQSAETLYPEVPASQILTLEQIIERPEVLVNIKTRPFLIDNYTMIKIAEIMSAAHDKYTNNILERDRFVDTIRREIDNFRSSVPSTSTSHHHYERESRIRQPRNSRGFF
jgi:hypothetical protein